MTNYKEMYHMLFKVIEELQEIQQKTEELYINTDETSVIVVDNDIKMIY